MTSAVPHGGITSAGNIHVPYQWTYADAAARGAATGFVVTDVGKLARQLDDNSLWMLTDDTPETWVAVGGTIYTDEMARDALGTALVAGNNIDIAVNDGADTITIGVEALTSVDIGDFTEAAQDAIGALITDSSSLDATYNDAGNVESIAIIDEYIYDLIQAMFVDGTGIDFTTSDPGNTITAEPIFGGTGSAGTVAHSDHTHTTGGAVITVQEGDADVDTAVTTLDFDASDFNITSTPSGEANIALNYGTAADTPAAGNHTHTGSTVSGLPNLLSPAQWVTGSTNYYGLIDLAGMLDLSTTGNALTADTMQACLFPVARDGLGNLPTFDQVAVNVSGLIALSTIRLGVYAVGSDGAPGALIADWGTVSSASTGDKTLSISWAPTQGWYYLVQVSTHAPSVLRQTSGRIAPIGHTSVANLAMGTDYTRLIAGSSAALPNPFGTPVRVTNHRPIWLRVA